MKKIKKILNLIKTHIYTFLLVFTSLLFGLFLLVERPSWTNIAEAEGTEEAEAVEIIQEEAEKAETQEEAEKAETTDKSEEAEAIDKSEEAEAIEGTINTESTENLQKNEEKIDIQKLVSEEAYNSTLDENGISWLEAFNSGITPVTPYENTGKHNRYYTDLGLTAGNTTADYLVEGRSYFNDTCWIGDSRALGVYDYGKFQGDFYCDNGYCFYNYHLGKEVTFQNEHRKVKINEALAEKKYGKIYIIMGINDCGYMTTTDIRSYMADFVSMLKKTQPDSIIFLCANMHVSRKIEETKDEYSNLNINAKNLALASLADGERIFYLDYNDLYTDEDGFLIDSKTFDGFHLYGKEYSPLIDFFFRHGIKTNN